MRRVAALLIALLVLPLAGCLDDAPAAVDAAGIGATVPPLAFGAAVAMEQPTGGAEPNIAVLPDGTIFVTAVAGSQEKPNFDEGAAWLWRSRDGGATWETLRAPSRDTPLGELPQTRKPFGSSDADVVASPDGWVYYSDWWLAGSPLVVPMPVTTGLPVSPNSRAGNFLVERSSDGGDSWESVSVTVPDYTHVDRQWLVAGADGFVGLFYAYFEPSADEGLCGDVRVNCNDKFQMSIKAVFSGDHGETWGDAVEVVGPQESVAYQIGHPFVLPDGTLAMPYGYVPIKGSYWRDRAEARVAFSADGGATWTHSPSMILYQGFDNLWAVQGAADEAGNVYVAAAARMNDTNMGVWLSKSWDKGASWADPQPLRVDGLNFLPWVAARGDGDVVVGWYGGNATGEPTEAPADAEWFAYAWDSRSNATARVSDEPVKVGPMCPRGASCGGERELLDYVSVAFAPDGALHYGFARSRELENGQKAGLVHVAKAVS